MQISLEDDERTLTMVEDLCSEDVAGNSSNLSPAPLADERDAAADISSKSVKDNKEKILTESEEAMAKLTVVHADLGEFFAFNKSCISWFQKRSCWNLLVINANLLLMTTYVAGNCISTLRKLELSLKLHVHVTITISGNGHHLRF